MRKIDAFAHILPRAYFERLERQLAKTMAPHRLDYYREGVFSFDPVLTDLDARWRKIEPYGDYAQLLVLAVPPLEEVGPPKVAAELARLANDELAELVQRFGDRFAGFAGFAAALGCRGGLARARPRPDAARRAGRTALHQRPGHSARRCALRAAVGQAAPCGCTRRAARRGPTIRPRAGATLACGGHSAGPTRPPPPLHAWSIPGTWSVTRASS